MIRLLNYLLKWLKSLIKLKVSESYDFPNNEHYMLKKSPNIFTRCKVATKVGNKP